MGDLTNEETHLMVEDIVANAGGILYSGDKKILFSSDTIMSTEELFNQVKQIFKFLKL